MASTTSAAPAPPSPAGREVLITRTFNAPRELVFQAWTDKERLLQWYAPSGCRIEIRSLDARVGGRFHWCVHAPNGDACWCIGEYLEVDPPGRIVLTMRMADEHGNAVSSTAAGKAADWPEVTTVTVTLEDVAGDTRLTLHQTVAEEVAKRTGAYPSWLNMLGRLSDDLAQQQGVVSLVGEDEALVVTHTFDAPRELVWRAYSDEAELRQWWGPQGCEMAYAKLDFRDGGRFHYGMRTPDGQMMWGKMLYCDLKAPERMTSVVCFSDEEGGTTRHPFVPNWPRELYGVMTLEEHDGKTTLRLQVRPQNATQRERDAFAAGRDGMMLGFKGSFAQLEEHLKRMKS
jgi:uncharacterized protein YndB with AHSA1/START domain